MIKEILEYGDGPAPMPRLPMSAYPMGMVPSIHDQISDHLKRNWLLYLLGGGALFGPGFKKLSAANKAYSALQRHTADNNRLHQLYDNGKHDDVLRAHGYDPKNFGSDKEREDASTRLMAANDMELQNKFGKAQETYNNASNSMLGGIFSPKDPNGFNSGLNFNGLGSPGVNFDAVEDEQRKQYSEQYKKAQNRVKEVADDYLKKNPNAKESELRRHLMNSSELKNDQDINHKLFSGTDHDLEHFVDDQMRYRQRQKAKEQELDDLDQQNKQNLVNSDPNSLNDQQKIDRFKEVLNNNDDLKSTYKNLTHWRDTFRQDVPEGSDFGNLLRTYGKNIPIFKDYISKDDGSELSNEEQRLNTLSRSLQYIHANGDDFAQQPSHDQAMADLAQKALQDPKHAEAANLSGKDLQDYIIKNKNGIIDDMENHHDITMLQHIAGLFKDHGMGARHISALWNNKNYNEIDPTTLRYNSNLQQSSGQNNQTQTQNQNQNQNNAGSSGNQQQISPEEQSFNNIYSKLSDDQKNRMSFVHHYNDLKVGSGSGQNSSDIYNAAYDLINQNKRLGLDVNNDDHLNGVAKMIKGSYLGKIYNKPTDPNATDADHINSAKNYVLTQLGKTYSNFNNQQNPSTPTIADYHAGFSQGAGDTLQKKVNSTITGNQSGTPQYNHVQQSQFIPKVQSPHFESYSRINDIIKSYLFNEDSDEFEHDSNQDLNFDSNDNKKSGFLKKHYGKILAGLGAAALGITRNHLKANAHDENAQYFKSIGNHDLADSELAKAHVRRSIDPIYRGKNMYNSLKDRFSNSD